MDMGNLGADLNAILSPVRKRSLGAAGKKGIKPLVFVDKEFIFHSSS